MKQLFILLAAVAVCSTQLHAQMPASPASPVRAGSWLIGGHLSFQSRGGDLYKDHDGNAVTAFSISPEAQCFIIDYFAIGGLMQLNTESADLSTSDILIGPKVSYYFRTSNRYFYPFVSAAALFGSYSYELYGDAAETNTVLKYTDTETRFVFSGGVLFMINQHVGIATTISYEMVNVNYDESIPFVNEANEAVGHSYDGNIFGISVGVNAFIP